MTPKKFLSCDWGSSSLRIRLFNTETGKVEGMYSSEEGIISTNKEWLANPETSRVDFYKLRLRNGLNQLESSLDQDLSSLPMVISGMASSTIGMMPLPYASLPFSLDGNALETMRIPASDSFPNEIILVSGVRSEADVMRGEETELLGYASYPEKPDDGIFIFPGTHSKHITVTAGSATAFSTFMTGEVFSLLSEQSILRSAIHAGDLREAGHLSAFTNGVEQSGQGNLLHEFFTVRTAELFGTRTAEENYFFLSGLLIGHELAALKPGEHASIYVCAQGKILELYKSALMVLGHEDKTRTFSTQRSDAAVAVGQYRIYQNNK